MSEITIERLQEKIKTLNAEFQATKQMGNELLNSNHQLRTNLIMFQQAHQELAQVNAKLSEEIKELNAKLLPVTE